MLMEMVMPPHVDWSCLRTLEGHTDGVRSVAFSMDGRILASGGSDRTVRLWNPDTGQLMRTIEGHGGTVLAVAFSPDGKTLASASGDTKVRVWDVESGECVRTLDQHWREVWAVAFSPDGRRLATGGEDGTVMVWDLASGECVLRLSAESWVTGVAFSPEGDVLASSCPESRRTHLWDPASGECLKTLIGHGGNVAFGRRGSAFLATAGCDNNVCLWMLPSGSQQTLKGEARIYGGIADGVSVSPDGSLVASGSDYKEAHLWDPSLGRRVQVLEGHQHNVLGVAFRPQGTAMLATGSIDRTIRLGTAGVASRSGSVDARSWIDRVLDCQPAGAPATAPAAAQTAEAEFTRSHSSLERCRLPKYTAVRFPAGKLRR